MAVLEAELLADAGGARSDSRGINWPSARQCKWIDGDPKREGEWSWCLEPVGAAGQQYCAAHLQRVYNPDRR